MKVRSILFSLVAVAGAIMICNTTANAQTYAEPTNDETNNYRRKGPCRDPWVSMAIERVAGRIAQGQGDFGECNTQLYNGGSWNSYNELAQSVKRALGVMNEAGVRYAINRSGSEATIKLFDTGVAVDTIRIRLVGADGSSLIGADGSSLVAAGAGNAIYKVQSDGNEKRINLGKSVLIIRK